MDKLIKILLADRHTLVREGLQQLITATAAEMVVVGLAGDSAGALKLADELEPDVAILDANLPGLEETTHHLAAELPEVKTLILADECRVQQVLSLLRAGATGYLGKNITGQELLAALRLVSLGEMALDPTVARAVVDQLTHHRTHLLSEGDSFRECLTEREAEVLNLLCLGETDRQIAKKLYLSRRTVNGHLRHIYAKMGVHSRTEAMRLAIEKGWVALPG
jgi:DNA-binding NarL/FixJ family response regulator